MLDVRRNDGRDTGHITGSVHIPIHQVLQRLDEVPLGQVGALRRRLPPGVDDAFDNAAAAGLPITVATP